MSIVVTSLLIITISFLHYQQYPIYEWEFILEYVKDNRQKEDFKSIASKHGLYKLHKHSHLYTSQKLISEFEGRIFKVKKVVNPDKKSLTKLPKKANLACRNYPHKVNVLKKKIKLNDGGNDYIFATTLKGEKLKLIVCEKV